MKRFWIKLSIIFALFALGVFTLYGTVYHGVYIMSVAFITMAAIEIGQAYSLNEREEFVAASSRHIAAAIFLSVGFMSLLFITAIAILQMQQPGLMANSTPNMYADFSRM